MEVSRAQLMTAMQRWGFLEDPAPDAALRWIETFLEAYGQQLEGVDDAYPLVAALRSEACVIPALELERLRTRNVLFFLDSVGQYIDHQPELRGLPLSQDIPTIAAEFGISKDDAFYAARMALTGAKDGPPLELALSAPRTRPHVDPHRCGEFTAASWTRVGTNSLRSRREAVRADTIEGTRR